MAGDVVGASKSLNRTISDVMAHLGDTGGRPTAGLRSFLEEKLGDLSEKWFRKGFNRGHRESHAAFEAEGKVPRKLEFECRRTLSPKQNRKLKLKSAVKKASSKKTRP